MKLRGELSAAPTRWVGYTCSEAAVGGPITLVRNGDMITLDVAGRFLSVDVDEKTMAERREAWKPIHPQATRGYVKMYQETVMQANVGAGLDFLVGGSGAEVPRDSH